MQNSVTVTGILVGESGEKVRSPRATLGILLMTELWSLSLGQCEKPTFKNLSGAQSSNEKPWTED